MLLLSLTGASSVWAQVATASGTTGINKPENAIDGNLGTRWESLYTNDQWFKVDYGVTVDFNTINILWQAHNSYAKSFKILASNDDAVGHASSVDPSQWEELYSVENQTLEAPYHQTIPVGSVSYRYVCFYGVERISTVGYSFFEFFASINSGPLESVDQNYIAEFKSAGPFNMAIMSLYGGSSTPEQMTFEVSDDGTNWEEKAVQSTLTIENYGFFFLGEDCNSKYYRYNFKKSSTTTGYNIFAATDQSEIIVDSPSQNVHKGETVQLSASLSIGDNLLPITDPSQVRVELTNPDVGSIDATGKFTATAEEGETTVKVIWTGGLPNNFANPSPVGEITLKVQPPTKYEASQSAEGKGPEKAFDLSEADADIWDSGTVAAPNDIVTLSIDNGYPLEFDIIGIVWGNSGAKAVKVLASNDGETWDELCATRVQGVKSDKTKQGLALGETVSYRYFTFEFTANATTGVKVREIYFDNVKPNTLRMGATYLYTQPLLGENVTFTFTVGTEGGNTFNVAEDNSTIITCNSEDGKVASRGFKSIRDGEITVSGELHKFGFDPADPGEAIMTTSVTFTVKDYHFAERTLVHTHGIAEEYSTGGTLSTRSDNSGWQDVPSEVNTEFVTSSDDPRVKDGVRQRTHVTEHYIYASPGETIYLIPYTDFNGSAQYYETLTRWYDYATDGACEGLTMYNNTNALTTIKSDNFGIYVGRLIGASARTDNTIGKLVVPADADLSTPIYVAMDATQTPSGNPVKAMFDAFVREEGKLYEPLVNFRHLFIIRSAAEQAETFSGSAEANAEYVKTHKRHITARAGVDFQVRLDEMISNGANNATNLVYKKADGTVGRIAQAYIKVYNDKGEEVTGMFAFGHSTSTFVGPSASKSFFRTLTCSAGNAKEGLYTVKIYGKDMSGQNIMITDSFDNEVPFEIQEYEIRFANAANASFYNEDELSQHSAEITHQQYGYLNSHYGQPVAVVNYDQYPLNDPRYVSTTTSNKKYYKWPVPWEESNYSFGYYNRHDYNMYMLGTHSSITPYHAGADTWPAAKNFPGTKYGTNAGTGLYDRRFYESKGEEMGYFYYINAAGDPGVMARLKIDDLCLGSRLFVTGWVAEFSQTSEKANLIFNFNVVLKDGRTVTLHSYTTGYVPDAENCGKWFKAYYSFVPNVSDVKFSADQIDHYELSLENNCTNSSGADYAIDDIRVWVSKPEVRADQMLPLCIGRGSEKATDVKVSVNYESLLATMGLTAASSAATGQDFELFYTFLDKDIYDGTADKATAFNNSIVRYQYDQSNPNLQQGFGRVTYNTYYEANAETLREMIEGNRYLIFNTRPKDDNLVPGKEYIIAIWTPDLGRLTEAEREELTVNPEQFVLQYSKFQIEDNCSKNCVFRVKGSGVIKINGMIESDEDNVRCCANQYAIIQIDANGMVPTDPNNPNSETEMTVIEKNAFYDWYTGSVEQYYQERWPAEGGEGSFTLEEALMAFREYYPEGNAQSAIPHSDKKDAANETIVLTQEMINFINSLTTPDATGKAKLQLFRRSCVLEPSHISTAGETIYVVAIPVKRDKYYVEYPTGIKELNGNEVLVCTDPTELRIFVESVAPHLVHGFSQIDSHYPTSMVDVPLRIGLDQIIRSSQPYETLKDITPDKTMADKVRLSIPLRRVDTTVDELTRLRRGSDLVVYLTETNDPEYSGLPKSERPIVPYPTVNADDALILPQVGVLLDVSADKQKLSESIFRMIFCDDFKFKEGYYYRLLFNYTEEYPENWEGTRTNCDGQLIFTLKVVPKYQMWTGAAGNTDFNNDLNWRRVTSTELHHNFTDDADSKRRKVTDGYADTVGNGGYANAFCYAPLEWTDVLVPDLSNYPRMYDVTGDAINISVSVFEGAGNPYQWPKEGFATATPSVQYDMAAYDANKGVNCRPWYANTCEHITFLPNAEIYQQQHLNYQRAWVELEVDKDRWYTLTSPLQKTVAGDMYLPTTTAARQVTEHFLPITYSNLLNDRFRPAVYQRSWDKAGSANVYHLPGDNIITNAAIQAHWSHVFNEVKENYTEGKGFSILTDVSRLDGANDIQKVLFRLPKDDAQYYYHNVELPTEGYSGTQKGDYTNIDRGAYTAYNGASVPLQARLNEVNGTITATTQTAGKYFLVGNPLMAHLDMKKFFDANSSKIQPKYWIMTSSMQESVIMTGDGTTVGTGDNSNLGSVAPLQGFFVEAKTAGTSIELSYTADMMKNFDASETRPQLRAPKSRSGVAESGQLRLMLMDNDRLISSATVALQAGASDNYEESEDAILLLDSNLDDQAAVYTVAGETAVSINSLERVSCVPLGIICPGDEAAQKPVTLTFDGADIFPQPLYLYDAATGDMTPIEDGMQLLLPARSSGQYFITTGIEEMETAAEEGGPAYNLKGIRVANTRNERIVIRDGRKSVVK